MPSAFSDSLIASVPEPTPMACLRSDQIGEAPLEFAQRLAEREIAGRHEGAQFPPEILAIGELLRQI